jgi:hypothetical protein
MRALLFSVSLLLLLGAVLIVLNRGPEGSDRPAKTVVGWVDLEVPGMT